MPSYAVDCIARTNLRLRASPKWLFLLQRATGRTGVLPVALGHHEARNRESERLGLHAAEDRVFECDVLVLAGVDAEFPYSRKMMPELDLKSLMGDIDSTKMDFSYTAHCHLGAKML